MDVARYYCYLQYCLFSRDHKEMPWLRVEGYKSGQLGVSDMGCFHSSSQLKFANMSSSH